MYLEPAILSEGRDCFELNGLRGEKKKRKKRNKNGRAMLSSHWRHHGKTRVRVFRGEIAAKAKRVEKKKEKKKEATQTERKELETGKTYLTFLPGWKILEGLDKPNEMRWCQMPEHFTGCGARRCGLFGECKSTPKGMSSCSGMILF